MKKIILALSVVSLIVLVYACSRESIKKINFVKNTDKTMKQMLAEAKLQRKVLFVDVYTTWCGPCKWMDENTFKDARVAEKLNKKFLNYKRLNPLRRVFIACNSAIKKMNSSFGFRESYFGECQ